jgi:glycosyltransferase involved in cell wall biosynthesis
MIAPPWFEVPPQGYGGIELMVYWLVNGLCARGHDVTLIAAGRNHTPARFLQTFSEPPSLRLGESPPDVLHAARAARALERLDVDLVHDHSLAGPLLAEARAIPTVVTAHGPVDGEMAEYYRNLSPTVMLVAVSDSQRRIAPDLPWIRTVHNAVRVQEYPFSDAKEDFVLFLGRMGPEKGAHVAIDAARLAGARLIVAGRCQEPVERRYFEEEIVPRLGPGIDWVGQIDVKRKKELLSKARCLIFPIQWEEPFGMVMVEALSCGTPVVALDRGSVPEVVENGVTGVICRDLRELAEGIERAGSIDSAACRASARSRFDVEAMVAGYEDAYRRALECLGMR